MKAHSTLALNLTLALCLVLGGATVALGQSTTGSLSGVVTAQEDGAALPGAVINAVHEPTGTRYNTITDAQGRFRILNVRVGGPYNISASLDGFRAEDKGDVVARLGEDTFLTFKLQLETVTETLTVVAESSPLINPSRTGASSNVSSEAITSLPTINRNFNDFARTNPLMTISATNEDPEAISVAGRSGRFNNISIDGSVNNDLFGLSASGTPGGQAGTSPVSLDAIQELELVISDFDVKNGGFSGGAVNAITKSGSNNFKGSVFFYTRDDGYFGDGPDELGTFGEFTEDQYGFTLGGPISRDKVFFFASVDLEERTTPTGWSIDGSTGQAFGLVEEANRFRQILIDNYGFDPGGLGENGRDNPSDKYLFKLDFNLNESHNLTLRHNFVDAGLDINRPGSVTYEFPSETYDFQSETSSTVAQLNSVFGTDKFNEFRLATQTIKDRRAGRDGLVFPWIEIEDVNGSGPGRNEFEAGTEPFSTRNSLDQDILEIHDDFTWIKGDHTLTFGTHNELFSFDNLFIQNAFGSYEFADLDALEAGIARRFAYTEVLPGQPASQKFDVNQLGFYFGDRWTVRSDLTVNYGLRVDIPYFPDTPSRNPLTEDLYGLRTDSIPDGNPLWQPRFGFNWDLSGDGTGQLRGGAGVFAGRTPYVWISNNYARTGIEQLFITCFNVPFNPDPLNQSADCASSGAIGEFNLIDPDFEFPQLLKLSLAYDRQLPWWDLILTGEILITDSLKEMDYQNANLVQTGDRTFDGRPFYTRVDSGIDGAYLITNTNEGESTSFYLKLERPYRNGLWGYVSYAYNEAKVINDGTSSRAVSNWTFQEGLDPNNINLSISDFSVEHRFNASLSYRFNNDSRYPTTVSFYYNLQSGRPFAYLMGSDFVAFGFGRSVNGDGTDANDLFYVPAGPDDVVIVGGGTYAQLDAFISSQPELDSRRGSVVPRNVATAPWNHTLDLHVEQDIPIKNSRLKLTFDLLNLMNLLDENSGVLRYVNFGTIEVAELEGVTDDGRPIYSLGNAVLNPDSLFTTHNLNSRWRAKLGIRWSF